jgi:eukaryotic-like serine/threonine-protein kinase
MRHLEEPVPLPSSRVADLPADLDEVVLRATAKSPADRYADADAMAAALAAHEMRADAATRALPAGEATSVLDLGAASTSVGASTAMMPTVGVPTVGERSAPRTPPPAPTRRSRAARRGRSGPSPVVWVLLAAVVALGGILGYVLLSGSDAPTATSGARPSASAQEPSPTSSKTIPPSDGSTVPGGLVGQQRDAAVDELIRLGVNVRWVLVRSTQPDGAVMGSFPAEGEPMTKGQTVALVVSRGHAPDQVNSDFVVPDGLVGTGAKDAEKTLDREDVRVTRVTVPSEGEGGQVIATWPAAGTRTADGIVVLVVSGGDKGGSSEDDG